MHIYTDASSRGGVSGIAFVATNARNKEVCKKGVIIPKGDNNTAELCAILFALEFMKNRVEKSIIILTDSSYAISAIRNGCYRSNERNMVREIKALMVARNVSLMWIKGHCQDKTILSYYNKQADKESKKVRRQYEKIKRMETKMKSKISILQQVAQTR